MKNMNLRGISSGREVQDYVTPECKLYPIAIEQSIMSVKRNGDNEQTEEEDLF